jgi:hypothetical protein
VLATAAPSRFEVTPIIQSGVGPLRRQVDSGYRGADYDFITATSPTADTISFALDTKRARTEVRAQSTQGKLLRDLVSRASTASSQDPRLGHTLFQLLVPPEVEPFLAGTSRMLIELDDRTAVIPWELLDTRNGEGADGISGAGARSDNRPWAIRTQLLRKLRQENYRQQVQDASSDDAVLVIGEPAVDGALYGPLPGALAEAKAVAAVLQGPGRHRGAARHGAHRQQHRGQRDQRPVRAPLPHRARGGARRAGDEDGTGRFAEQGWRRAVRGQLPGQRRDQEHAHGARAGVRQLLPPRRRATAGVP